MYVLAYATHGLAQDVVVVEGQLRYVVYGPPARSCRVVAPTHLRLAGQGVEGYADYAFAWVAMHAAEGSQLAHIAQY